MNRFFPVVLGIAALTAASAGFAETCQWKDGAGRTVVSDQPPPGNARDIRCSGGGSFTPSVAPSAAPTGPKTTAEKDMDFKKRQQESADKADKAAKEQTAAAERKENCERAQRQLALLESGQRVAMPDASGERRFLEDNERQAEIERTRRMTADAYK